MDTVSSSPTSKRAEQASSGLRAWLDRQPLWVAQIIAVVITWICVAACVLLFVLATGLYGT